MARSRLSDGAMRSPLLPPVRRLRYSTCTFPLCSDCKLDLSGKLYNQDITYLSLHLMRKTLETRRFQAMGATAFNLHRPTAGARLAVRVAPLHHLQQRASFVDYHGADAELLQPR